MLSQNLENLEAERKSYIIDIIRETQCAWENEMISNKGYNKIMNICSKELYWKYKEEK